MEDQYLQTEASEALKTQIKEEKEDIEMLRSNDQKYKIMCRHYGEDNHDINKSCTFKGEEINARAAGDIP